MTDCNDLLAKAGAATPGEWHNAGGGVILAGPVRLYARGAAQGQLASICILDEGEEIDPVKRREANAAYITATRPAVVIPLVEAHIALLEELAEVKEHDHNATDAYKRLRIIHNRTRLQLIEATKAIQEIKRRVKAKAAPGTET